MNVVVTGGGTVAPIDEVRQITNVSSGRFSAALSEACLGRGASVWHLHAPAAHLPIPRAARLDLTLSGPRLDDELTRLRRLSRFYEEHAGRLHLVPLAEGTVADYSATLEGLLREVRPDLIFLAMAVSDYEPEPVAGKIDSDEPVITIRARRAPKVIRSVRDWSPSVFLVGFKLLSRADPAALIRAAEAACLRNRADLTVANDLQTLLEDRHTVHLVRPGYPAETLGPGASIAEDLVDRVLALAAER